VLVRRRAHSLFLAAFEVLCGLLLLPPSGLIVARRRWVSLRRRSVGSSERAGWSQRRFMGCREVGWWREIIDCLEKNLQTSYRALPFILFLPSVESQLARKTDTVPPYHIMTQSSRPRKTHDCSRPPRGQHSTRGNRTKDTQARTVRKKKKDAQAQPKRNTYVRRRRTRKQYNSDKEKGPRPAGGL